MRAIQCIFPRFRCELLTELEPDDVLRRIQENISNNPLWGFGKGRFEGKITAGGFEIKPRAGGDASQLTIRGKVVSVDAGSLVTITTHLGWFGLVVVVGIGAVLMRFFLEWWGIGAWAHTFLMCFGTALLAGGLRALTVKRFWREVDGEIDNLVLVLEARIKEIDTVAHDTSRHP